MSRLYIVARSAGCWALLALLTLGAAAVYVPIALIAREGRAAQAIERYYLGFILWASRVRLTASGLEHVEPGRSYIVMANHRSLYDVPVIHYLLSTGRDLRWIGKQEVLDVPALGWMFGMSRHVPIDRAHRGRAIAALRDAAAASVQGVSFVIMPEGTRSVQAELLPFKKGGFHLAVDTGLPILPIAIHGSEKLMRKDSWQILPGAIHVTVLPPVETAGCGPSDVVPLLDRVRAAIAAALEAPTPASERCPGERSSRH